MCFGFSGCYNVEQSRRLPRDNAKTRERLAIWRVTYPNVRDSQHALARN
jgi:hypothetical protein